MEKVDRDRQTSDAGNNEGKGRPQEVDKMDTLEKFWEVWGWFNGYRKDHRFGWGMT